MTVRSKARFQFHSSKFNLNIAQNNSKTSFWEKFNIFLKKQTWHPFCLNVDKAIFWSKKTLWRRGVVVISTAQLHSTKPELGFCAGANPACGVSEIRDGEDIWKWSRLEIKLNNFRRSTITQKQFIIENNR